MLLKALKTSAMMITPLTRTRDCAYAISTSSGNANMSRVKLKRGRNVYTLCTKCKNKDHFQEELLHFCVYSTFNQVFQHI